MGGLSFLLVAVNDCGWSGGRMRDSLFQIPAYSTLNT